MFATKYQRILSVYRPFLLAHPASFAHLDLEPFGVTIPEERRLDPTRLATSPFIDGLHALDGFAFGPREMLMPRWVLFDCGELPGIVFGFACAARELPAAARAAYGAAAEPDEALVPLSMWVAIRCADPDVWLGHNLSSVNEVLGEAPLRGLATLTKGLGVRLTRAKAQIGATQWASPSASLHLAFGEMRLLSAWTPAHTHPATFSYRIEIDPARLLARMGSPPVSSPGSPSPPPPHDLCVESTDEGSFRRLQRDIEAGAQVTLVGVDHGPLGPSGRPARPSRMYLRVGSIGAPGAA